MSVKTQIQLLNANDPEYLAALNGTEEEKEDWESSNADLDWYPGKVLDIEDFYEETEEEYGGWIIDLSKLPKEATHIKISRY